MGNSKEPQPGDKGNGAGSQAANSTGEKDSARKPSQAGRNKDGTNSEKGGRAEQQADDNNPANRSNGKPNAKPFDLKARPLNDSFVPGTEKGITTLQVDETEGKKRTDAALRAPTDIKPGNTASKFVIKPQASNETVDTRGKSFSRAEIEEMIRKSGKSGNRLSAEERHRMELYYRSLKDFE